MEQQPVLFGAAENLNKTEIGKNNIEFTSNSSNNKQIINKKYNSGKEPKPRTNHQNKITTRHIPMQIDQNAGMKMKISTALTGQTNDQTYITQDENDPESSGIIDK